MPSTNTSINGGGKIQIFNKQPMTLNNTITSQPRPPMSTIINQPQIVYIRASTPWGGINGLQPQGPTKLIRISNGNCIQQRPICITPATNGPSGTGTGSGNDTKAIPSNHNTTQQAQKIIQYVSNPTSTFGTNQNAPRLPYNAVRMLTSPNSLGLRPQQVIRPIYQTTLRPPSIPSQPGCQQIRIIQRPSHGMVNSLNVVRTQLIMPHQTNDYRNLQRPPSFQPIQTPIRPNSLQTQSQICAWPQPMAPSSHIEAAHNSQQSQILSSSQTSPQNWQSVPINATNGTQPLNISQCVQPYPPPSFQSESNTTDLRPQNTVGLVSQVSKLSSPLTIKNLMSTTMLASDASNVTSSNPIEENTNMSSVSLHNKLFNNSRHPSTEQLNSVVLSHGNPPFLDSQPIDVEYEKLMASVGII